MVLNSVLERPGSANSYAWELDCHAVLYTPIGEIGRQPIGLLVIGCRQDPWYSEEDVAYAHRLGCSLAPLVAALKRPLSRLKEDEGEVLQLLSYGLSSSEIARAVRTDDRHARALVDRVTKKMQSVTADDLTFPIVEMKRRAFRI